MLFFLVEVFIAFY